MGLEEFAYLPEILVRNQPHRNLGRGFRGNHRLGSLAGITSPNAVDVERRTDSGAFEGGEPGFALDVADAERTLVGGQAERRLVESPALGGRELADIVVEARNRHAAVLVDKTGDEPGQHVGGVGDGTSEEPRMEVLVGPGHFNLHVSQPAQPAGNGGSGHGKHRGIRHQNDVGFQQLFIAAAETVKAGRPDLLLALQHELDVAGKRIGGAHGLERLGVHPQLPLVVVGAAGPNAAVLDDGLERVGPPLGTRVDGHDVVVAVDQHGFSLGIDDFLGVHHRIAVGRHHLGPVGTRLDQSRGEPLGATLHVGLVLGLRADRRDT